MHPRPLHRDGLSAPDWRSAAPPAASPAATPATEKKCDPFSSYYGESRIKCRGENDKDAPLMARVLLTPSVDLTSGTVCATLKIAHGRCPNCTDVELPGWLVPSGSGDQILPEESESEMMNRMCDACSSYKESFCNGECLMVSYDKFYDERWEALCDCCGATMSWCGEEWDSTCTRCDGAFCATCAARLRC